MEINVFLCYNRKELNGIKNYREISRNEILWLNELVVLYIILYTYIIIVRALKNNKTEKWGLNG